MTSGLDRYLQEMAERLNATEVKAGFYGGATYPDGELVSQVAAGNEWGDPANHQPPRPFFRIAVKDHKKEWAETIAKGLEQGRDARTVLEVVGAQIKGDVQQSIADLMEPGLSPVTIEKRRTRADRPNSSTKPLVDTGVMIGDVNYEVT